MVAELSPSMLLDALAVQIDGPRASDEHLTIDVRITDSGENYRVQLRTAS
jgi:alkyl sulfatase BDS1-like metallo-beta-lactamase superfamily hydrolase